MSTHTPDLTPAEAATALGVSVHAVRRLIRAGALEAYDMSLSPRRGTTGHRPTYRVPRTAVDRFRRTRTV